MTDKWSESTFRGRTSLNLPEMLGWSNKTTLVVGAGLFVAVGAFFLARNRGILEHVDEGYEDREY